MDGSLRLGNGHQGLWLILSGFVFGQVFLPDRALDLPDFLTGSKEQPGSNLDDAQPGVKVFGIGGLEFVHEELVFGESIIRRNRHNSCPKGSTSSRNSDSICFTATAFTSS